MVTVKKLGDLSGIKNTGKSKTSVIKPKLGYTSDTVKPKVYKQNFIALPQNPVMRQNPTGSSTPILAYTPNSGNNAYQQQQQIAQNLHQSYLDQKTPDLNDAIGGIGELASKLTDGETWFTIGGFIIGGIIILVALFGIINNAKANVIASTFGQNAKGLVNTVRPKRKAKK